jgi:3-deoxy-D-manno-octulosonic-acid transferase
MFLIYSIVYTLAFIVLLPRFLFDAVFNGKYAAGFKQRLGFLPKFNSAGKKVIWIHCVSVGETNAARPLAIKIKEIFPDFSLVISTTTRTGQNLAQTALTDIADLVFYFPFDWRSTVRRSLRHIKPSVVLLMETELWFNFIRETYHAGARLAIVNGRLSERSYGRYSKMRGFMNRVLGYLDLALMQGNADATRLMSLGIRASKVRVTGNLKFDHEPGANEAVLTDELRERFGITEDEPLIIAASTHAPEESWILEAFEKLRKTSGDNLPRLLIAPRHPERFNEVAETINEAGFSYARRTAPQSSRDATVEVILLDSIGELRAAYPLAEIVFVGGSLIAHGGQSIFEPAAAGRAIITGPHTANFHAAVSEFSDKDAIIQLPRIANKEIPTKLAAAFKELLSNTERRAALGANALSTINHNRGAVAKTLDYLLPLLEKRENQ